MDNNLPERKIIRKRGFDYSVSGAYFITICTQDRRNILSTVGDGASTSREDDYAIHLTPYGKIVEKYLLSSENIKNVKVDKYVIMPNHIHVIFFIENEDIASVASLNDFRDVEVSNPFRVSATIGSTPQSGAGTPSPTNMTVPRIISAFKRMCNKEIGENIFQRAYYDHIIRDYDDYVRRKNYIYENPRDWRIDELYTE